MIANKRLANKSSLMRTHKDFKKIITAVRGRYLMEGKRPPTCTQITRFIARDVNDEEIFRRMLIQL